MNACGERDGPSGDMLASSRRNLVETHSQQIQQWHSSSCVHLLVCKNFAKYNTQSVCVFVSLFDYSITPILLDGWLRYFLGASELLQGRTDSNLVMIRAISLILEQLFS